VKLAACGTTGHGRGTDGAWGGAACACAVAAAARRGPSRGLAGRGAAPQPPAMPTLRALAAGGLAFTLLLVFLAAGEAVAWALGLPVPGSVLGMVLLTGALRAGLVGVERVRPAADPLLRHMGLLFVPPGVAVMVHFDLIRAQWPAIVAGSVVGTVAVLLVVAVVAERLEEPRP
jgi:holin-like protein